MSWDIDGFEHWTPDQIPVGFVAPEGGNSRAYLTGGWRTNRPLWNQDACTSCMMCWVVCPDGSITVADRIMTGIDYDHCKGCGICARECRFGALTMVSEASLKEV